MPGIGSPNKSSATARFCLEFKNCSENHIELNTYFRQESDVEVKNCDWKRCIYDSIHTTHC